MWLARIVAGRKPFVTRYQPTQIEMREVMTDNGLVEKSFVVPTQPRAWSFKNGAAAISYTSNEAIASATVRLIADEMDVERQTRRDKHRGVSE